VIGNYLGDTPRDQIWRGPIIDCDVHANVPSLETLFEYQDQLWVQWARERGFRGPRGLEIVYPPGAAKTAREEWRVAGQVPASDLATVQREILDPWAVERAVINCYYGVDSLRHPDWAAALASAVNDWIIDQWLNKDPRLVASITIPARDPVAAAAEIDRVSDHPGFRQVLIPVRAERLYGQRIFRPLYDAIARHDLVMGLHWGGTVEEVPNTSGPASWYAEEYAGELAIYAAHITSMIAEGVFTTYPDLRVAVMEGGFTWVPSWGWRMNQKWKGLRREIPWVTEPPMSILRKHFRFSTAPVDAGPLEQMKKAIGWLHSDDMLMFATDYPHMHGDDIPALLEAMPESMRANAMYNSAKDWYRL
jgi:predicted TIM-barrel fold metal-dependent hydrolase